jgi:hypothetical protein
MENENVRFTDPGTFVTEHLAKLTTPEKMEAFRLSEGLRYREFVMGVEKLIQSTGVGEVTRIILTLRDKRDVISAFRSGEPIRMVLMSNGLLVALKRHRDELNEEEHRILDELYDLLNLLI